MKYILISLFPVFCWSQSVVNEHGTTTSLDTLKMMQNYQMRQFGINDLAANEVPVFIIGGQSNAQGGGEDSDGTAGEIDLNTNVKILSNGNPTGFVDLNIGANNTGGREVTQHGVELEWQNIRDTFFPTKTLYIIKEAIGGTTIDPHHLPGGTAYDSLWLHFVHTGLNSIIDAGFIPVVSFYYMQGEIDASTGTSQVAYEASMKKLIARWQANISPDMPMIFGDVSHGTSYDSVTAIVTAQRTVAGLYDLVTTVPTVGYPKWDASHFTYVGLKQLARAFYNSLADSIGVPGVRISKRFTLNGAHSSGTLAGAVILTAEANEDFTIKSPTYATLLKVEVDVNETQFANNKAAIDSLGRMRYNNATTTFDLTRAMRDNRGGTTFNNTGGVSYGDYMEFKQSGTAIAYGIFSDTRKTGGASGNILAFAGQVGASLGAAAAIGWGYRMNTPILSGGATITDYYAFYNETSTATGITNAYGLYMVGASDKHYIQGALGLNTTSPAASAQLDITSTTKGFLVPRMTYAQRDAITATQSLFIFNTGSQKFNYWQSPSWRVVADSATISATYLPLAGGTLTGNLLFTDNIYDIGASGATRPRTGYFGTSVVTPKLNITTGANASIGTSSAMVAGSTTVSTTAVTASSKIFVSTATAGGTQGFLSVANIVAGVSFDIISSGATDTSTVNWWIIN